MWLQEVFFSLPSESLPVPQRTNFFKTITHKVRTRVEKGCPGGSLTTEASYIVDYPLHPTIRAFLDD